MENLSGECLSNLFIVLKLKFHLNKYFHKINNNKSQNGVNIYNNWTKLQDNYLPLGNSHNTNNFKDNKASQKYNKTKKKDGKIGMIKNLSQSNLNGIKGNNIKDKTKTINNSQINLNHNHNQNLNHNHNKYQVSNLSNLINLSHHKANNSHNKGKANQQIKKKVVLFCDKIILCWLKKS